MGSQYNDQEKQGDHHDLADLFKPILQSLTADQKAGNDSKDHEKAHLQRTGKKRRENSTGILCTHAGPKGTGYKLYAIGDHPETVV